MKDRDMVLMGLQAEPLYSDVKLTACIYCYAAVVITPTVNVGLLLPGIYGAQYAVKDRYPPSAIMIIFPTTLMWLHISQFDVRRLGVPCPRNYNPSDYFIELLAVIPTREETCKQTIELICDNFKNSEIGLKIHHDTEPRTDLQMTSSHCRNPEDSYPKQVWWLDKKSRDMNKS
uniref:Uncharacterized protein n=1 Tax=Timema cristinae TaxID=61476 RepID=A0A7R9D106_TIMCR|nr:unnamed protein product [Timema cristinae]